MITGKPSPAGDVTGKDAQMAMTLYMMHLGLSDPQVSALTMESRDYLTAHNRSWLSMHPFSLDPDNNAPSALQTNAYPYADPKFSDDGRLFVYLPDAASTNIEDTVAAWAKKEGAGGYTDKGAITTQKGYGYSGFAVAGNDDLAAAVWVRQREKLPKDAGADMTYAESALMINSTEIVCSIDLFGN